MLPAARHACPRTQHAAAAGARRMRGRAGAAPDALVPVPAAAPRLVAVAWPAPPLEPVAQPLQPLRASHLAAAQVIQLRLPAGQGRAGGGKPGRRQGTASGSGPALEGPPTRMQLEAAVAAGSLQQAVKATEPPALQASSCQHLPGPGSAVVVESGAANRREVAQHRMGRAPQLPTVWKRQGAG